MMGSKLLKGEGNKNIYVIQELQGEYSIATRNDLDI